MTQHIIGYFCGTGYELFRDSCYQKIRRSIDKTSTILLGYDGCQVHGGGLFSIGVEEQANAFVNNLKSKINPHERHYQINFVAHSRGGLSALLAIKKIQADPDLKNKVTVTVDFRDPVPGNFQLTAKLAGGLASANQCHDFTDCDIVKKAHITLQEKPIIPLAFDALIPKFHHATHLEIETLPGYHDAQQRYWHVESVESDELLVLGNAKTLSILKEDGHALGDSETSLKEQQVAAYDALIPWARNRETPFGERDLHFGGKIVANNQVQTKIDAINWRHAMLKGNTANSILYETTHPDYNYRKTPMEHWCALTMALDNLLIDSAKKDSNNKMKLLVETIKTQTYHYQQGLIPVSTYRADCHQLLLAASIKDQKVIKAINYLSMSGFFKEMDQAVNKNVPKNSALRNELGELKGALLEEIAAEIERGRTLDQINKSKAVKIAGNTAEFIERVYGHKDPQNIIADADQFARDNIRLGRSWSVGNKMLVSTLVRVAATIVGCVLGVMVGIGIGFATGAISGPGAFITAFVGAFIGGFKGAVLAGACVGTAAGLISGVYGANHFFKCSPAEEHVQRLAAGIKDEFSASEEHDETAHYPPSGMALQ